MSETHDHVIPPHEFAAILIRIYGADPPDGLCADPRLVAMREATLRYERLHAANSDRLPVINEWKSLSADVTALRLALAEAHARIALDNAVCLCGCPASEHESTGEDGEQCEHEDHECLRVAPAVLEIVGRVRLALAEATHEAETLKTERGAALTLAEQRGAAYDMTWREVESLREWKDKLEAECDKITVLVDGWRNGRAHLGTPATFVDQRLLDGILKIGVSVSGQRGGTVTFSHWSGAATKPDEEHGDGGPPEE